MTNTTIHPNALCICGYAYKDHGDDPLGNCGCEGFEQTSAVFQVTPINPAYNLYRVVGPGFESGPMSGKMAADMAHDMNKGRS